MKRDYYRILKSRWNRYIQVNKKPPEEIYMNADDYEQYKKEWGNRFPLNLLTEISSREVCYFRGAKIKKNKGILIIS